MNLLCATYCCKTLVYDNIVHFKEFILWILIIHVVKLERSLTDSWLVLQETLPEEARSLVDAAQIVGVIEYSGSKMWPLSLGVLSLDKDVYTNATVSDTKLCAAAIDDPQFTPSSIVAYHVSTNQHSARENIFTCP